MLFEQEREALAEFDDEAGPERAREVDFDEADVGAGEATGWCGAGLGIPVRIHGQRQIDRGWIL